MKRLSYLFAAVLVAIALFFGGLWYVDRVNQTHPAPWPNAQGKASGSFATTALFPDEPAMLWSEPLPYALPYSPVIAADGTAYVAAGEQLIAVGADGARRWAWKSSERLGWIALGRHGEVYVLEREALVALDPEGRLSWRLPLPSAQWNTPPMVGQGGVLYVGTRQQLYAVNSDGTVKWTKKWNNSFAWLSEIADGLVVHVDRDQVSAVNPDGSLAWSSRLESTDHNGALAADAEGRLYYRGQNHLYVLDDGGLVKAKVPAARTRAINLAAGSGVVQEGLTRRSAGGDLIWERPQPEQTFYATYLDREGNVLLWVLNDGAGSLSLHSPEGEERWRLNGIQVGSLSAIGADGRICFTGRREGANQVELICIGDGDGDRTPR